MKVCNNAGFEVDWRSTVVYSHWEFKREEMNLQSWRRDLTEPHKLWGSEWNIRKCHERLKKLSPGAFKNKGDGSTFTMDLGNQPIYFTTVRTSNSKVVQFLDSEWYLRIQWQFSLPTTSLFKAWPNLSQNCRFKCISVAWIDNYLGGVM